MLYEVITLAVAAGAVHGVHVVLADLEELGAAGGPRAESLEVLRRITSYNVCYTKLLRLDWHPLRGGAPLQRPGAR